MNTRFDTKKRMRLALVFLPVVLAVLALALVSCEKKEEKATAPEEDTLEWNIGVTYPHYSDDFIDQMNQRYFDRPEIPAVLALLDLSDGTVAADVGCGPGAFTFPIARAVGPSGKVYATDIQARMIDSVKEHMADPKRNPYGNVVPVVNRPDDVTLDADSIDVIWLSQVHFHNGPTLLDANKRMIASVFRAVKPGGRLVIGDEPHAQTPDPAPNIIRHYTAAGFVLEKGPIQDTATPTTFYLVFRKPAK